MRFLPAAAIASILLFQPGPATADDTDARAWGRIVRAMAGGKRILVAPSHGTFVEGADVELYEKSRRVCGGTVKSSYGDSAYVDLGDDCFGQEYETARTLVLINATYHEISGAFVESEARVLRTGVELKGKGTPVKVKSLATRPAGKEGLSVSFGLLDSGGRLTSADGNARFLVYRIGDGREELLCRVEIPVRRSDFRLGNAGAKAPDGEMLSFGSRVIHYYEFLSPPPRKEGAKGRLELEFRSGDGGFVTDQVEFSFDERPGRPE